MFTPQSPFPHVTSHEHALGHVMSPHDPVAWQSMLQCSVLLAPHVMSPHDPVPEHVMSQLMPIGHMMSVPPLPSMMHVGGEVEY
jgi:hypothetical protein